MRRAATVGRICQMPNTALVTTIAAGPGSTRRKDPLQHAPEGSLLPQDSADRDADRDLVGEFAPGDPGDPAVRESRARRWNRGHKQPASAQGSGRPGPAAGPPAGSLSRRMPRSVAVRPPARGGGCQGDAGGAQVGDRIPLPGPGVPAREVVVGGECAAGRDREGRVPPRRGRSSALGRASGPPGSMGLPGPVRAGTASPAELARCALRIISRRDARGRSRRRG